jgi:hypothetical protein
MQGILMRLFQQRSSFFATDYTDFHRFFFTDYDGGKSICAPNLCESAKSVAKEWLNY